MFGFYGYGWSGMVIQMYIQVLRKWLLFKIFYIRNLLHLIYYKIALYYECSIRVVLLLYIWLFY